MKNNKTVKQLASLTFQLVASYQEKFGQLADERGLSHSEFKCLRLFGTDKHLNNKQIAKRMDLSASRSTRIIDGLVNKGYMTRKFDRNDWRSLDLNLTRKGKSFVKKINVSFYDIHFQILKEIKSSQHNRLIKMIGNLNSASEKWLNKPTKGLKRK
jgi:DNA-binding MarR family transcriptional regulator